MDTVGEFGPGRLAPRIRLPGVLQLPQTPAERPSMGIRQQNQQWSRVGMWRGGLRLRFHTPLIEPCWRISRTRLSDKGSCGRSREAAFSTLQAGQAQSL